MTDFHTHILPGLDDGSRELSEALALLRMEAEQGITQVVLTPHFYPYEESTESFLARRDQAEQSLRGAAAGQEGLPQMLVGAEVYYFRGMSQSEQLRHLAIRGTRAILIEMPPAPWSESMFRELAAIRETWGMIPVIAHIDRYIRPFRTYGIPERLARLPVLVQANASFFLHRQTAGMAMKLLKKGYIHLLGSDCHNLTTRQPNLAQARCQIEKKLGSAALSRMQSYEYQILGV